MRRCAPSIVLIAAGILLSGCATGSPAASASPGSSRNPDVITFEELSRETGNNAYEAIRHLRPSMLRSTGSTMSQSADASGKTVTRIDKLELQVYLNQTRLGGMDALKQVPIQAVTEIRYLNAIDASQRFGVGHPGGAIILTSR